ncbi:ABC transporter ATP-binding protein [Bradyrhizobium sp. BR13661]|jgi:branched-chain amino acid transport system ATP-binding protein|uniref:branched-chain amino acid ABC transporter ATP-binding protein n=1 Tax=Bradyrhizobium sp. BR13661 TaxID=2940622 RepID=UPI002475B1C5|nr:ABC transporter ATP-binding protein [Bradyrhizobium sp. BR13661]MDH6262577.1 branched-chain amino acid transport system ATP-binding protein [Bradyrhizobium sp. BR13661]
MLRTEHLDANYGMFQALFGINFAIERGEVVSLIGANGAGKSTLLRAIVGSVPVNAPSVLLDGKPVGGSAEINQLSRGIALVPEGRRLFPSLTVEENLLLAAKNGRRGPWTPDRLYRELPALQQLRARPATALSGGQQQLAAVGRALVTNPDFLLCDEISLGLSPVAVETVYELLGTVIGEGMAVVLVEQNVRRALSKSSRYYCMLKGKFVLEGISKTADYARVSAAYFGD